MVTALAAQDGPQRRREESISVRFCALLRFSRWCFGLALVVLLANRATGSLRQDATEPSEVREDSAARHLATVSSTSHYTSNASEVRVGSGCDENKHHEEIRSPLDSMLSMLLSGFVVCLLLEHCNFLVCVKLRLPISCVIFLAGMLSEELLKVWNKNVSGQETHVEDFLEGRLSVAQIDPHAIFYVLLPPLLYESSSSMPWHVIQRVLGSAVVLAGPGVALNVMITGLLAKLIVHDAAGELINWQVAFMLASILSATDPVAVVAALRTLGAPKKLSALVEGESLLNDGSAFVLFSVFKEIVAKSDVEDFGDVVSTFLYKFVCLAGGGVLVGVCVGCLVIVWIKRARFLHFPVLELAIVLCAVYGSFFLAERVGGSGVLTVVTFGLMMTANINPLLSHHARHAHHLTIDCIGYLSDRMIFFIGGMVSMRFLRITDSCDVSFAKLVAELICLYVILHITRSFVVACFSPLLQRSGYGLNAKEGAILVYGGLRGAVGLAMGLMVEHHEQIHQDIGTVVAFHTSGIVLLTILVNGSTVENLYRFLRPYADPVARVRLVMKALKKMEEKCQYHKSYGLKGMREHWLFFDAHFTRIYSCIPNFRTIEFDSQHRPQATGISTVHDTLNRLERIARTRHRATLDPTTSSIPLADSGQLSFTQAWRRRKAELAAGIHEWLPNAEGIRQASDIMHNVMDNGGHSIGYNPPETMSDPHKLVSGLFVSRRPLWAVSLEAQGLTGLCGPDKERPSSSTCTDSEVSVHTIPAVENQSATFTVKLKKLGCQSPWVGVVCSPSINNFSGEEPLLGFKEDTVGFSCVTGEIRYWIAGQSGSLSPLLLPKVGSLLHVTVELDENQMWQVAFALSFAGCSQVAVGTVAVGKASPQTLFPTVEFRAQEPEEGLLPHRPESHSSNSMSGQQPLVVRRVSTRATAENFLRHMTTVNIPAPVADSRVALSFEPQIPTDADDLDEIFSVFLNTVTRKYHKLHERGIVDEHALAWLQEAAGEALDCAHNEVHARHILEFFHGCKEPKLEMLKEKLCDVDRKGRYVFEPVIVEYLALWKFVSKVGIYDRFPAHWHFSPLIRSLGYFRTRTKVECLFAFVECHTEAIAEHEILGRFPGLMHCMASVLAAAKRDLALVEENAPRRFFFSKHYLVLKMDMSERVRALEEARDEGWISAGDVDGLIEELHERLAYVEQYFPCRIQVGNGGRAWPCGFGASQDDSDEEECAPAWSKVLDTIETRHSTVGSSFGEEVAP